MREQVIVLPPSSFSLNKKEEALLNTSKENRNWAVSERENGVIIRGFTLIERDQQEAIQAELSSGEKMKKEDGDEAVTEPSRGACEEEKQDKAYEEGRLAGERMKNPSSSNGEGALLLQWGLRKRSRLSRADTHNQGGRVDNHNLKPCSLADESSVLYRKTVRVQADRASAAQPNTSVLASKGTLKAKNGVVAKMEHPSSDDKRNQQAKVLKGGPSDVDQGTKGSPLGGRKRGYSPHVKQAEVLQQSKTCTLANPNLPPLDRCVTPLPGSNDASLSKIELVWPKFAIALSRKEKEEDFLIFKGTKLPQRPKRRPKVVEKALHYCSPGSWLTDVSLSRYDVREKKRGRKKPRGLKAMESLGSDSD